MKKTIVVLAVLTMVIAFSAYQGYAQAQQMCYDGIQVGQVCYIPCGGPYQESCYESYCNVYVPSGVPDGAVTTQGKVTTAGADLAVGQVDYIFCEGCPLSECVVYVPSGIEMPE